MHPADEHPDISAGTDATVLGCIGGRVWLPLDFDGKDGGQSDGREGI